MPKGKSPLSISDYLILRLREAGVRHLFGLPGDYILSFLDAVVASDLEFVGTCTEQGAAFAADAYARVNGLGVVCVTYAVGGFNALNAVAGAYAEKSPVVVISGSPGMNERVHAPMLHHKVKDFRTQRDVFEKVTAMAVVIEDAESAPELIDRVLARAIGTKRPVYIELPRDVATQPCRRPTAPLAPEPETSNPAALAEALAEAVAMLKEARRPAILAGVEVHRFGLQKQLMRLLTRSGVPVAATLLGKSVVSELHPQYAGVYEGAIGRDEVRRVVEDADCLLILGAFMTDVNLGGFSAHLTPSRTINASSERITIKHHSFEGAGLGAFMAGLIRKWPGPARPLPKATKKKDTFLPPAERAMPLTVSRLFERINDFIEDDMIVICDVGDSLFGGADLTIHRRTEFLSPAYYASMGFAIPAALGAQVGREKLRPIVIVGDGAFQMSAAELSTIAKQSLNPIVFVLNNKGYSTERAIHEGPYNNLPNWSYHQFTKLIDAGWGTEVETEGGLEVAMRLARLNQRSLSIINVHLDPADRSDALDRLGTRIAKQGGMKKSKAVQEAPAKRRK